MTTPKTTLIDDIDLRRLAELEGPERAFVTLYTSGPAGAATVPARARRLESLLADNAAELEHATQSLAMIEAWLEEHEPATACCVFACYALDLCEGYAIDLPLPDFLYAGDAPYIRPLANLRDEYETFALVVADNDGATIHLVTSGEAEKASRIKGGVKNHVRKGGWSQKRYQRRRANQLQSYARDVAEALAELSREEDFDRVVFVGSHDAINEIERELPTELDDKARKKKDIDLHEGDDHVLAEAFELFTAQERAAEKELWERIRDESMTGGLAATGATDVLAAALVGRVESVAVTRGVTIRGVKCRECENIVHGTPETCQICGSTSVFRVDLVDELARLAERTSADVDFVDPLPGLTDAGNVAALLRY